MTLRNNIRGLIFDLDNTLYENPSGKDGVFSQAAALAAIDLGLKLSFQQALDLAEKSYIDHKSESAVFCQTYGISEEDFHYHAHKHGTALMIQAVPPLKDFASAFNRLAAGYDIRILTHGSQYWAEQLSSHLGYSSSLKEGQILGLDHPAVAYRKKLSPDIFEDVANMMGLKTDEIAVVEDTAENLVSPYGLGMQTIFIHWGAPLETKPDYISHQVPNFSVL